MTAGLAIPAPCLVVLVGPGASGKSTWAAAHFRPDEVVSSDRLRAVVGSARTTSPPAPTRSRCSRRSSRRRVAPPADHGDRHARAGRRAPAGLAARWPARHGLAVRRGRLRHPGRGVPGAQPAPRQADPGRRARRASCGPGRRCGTRCRPRASTRCSRPSRCGSCRRRSSPRPRRCGAGSGSSRPGCGSGCTSARSPSRRCGRDRRPRCARSPPAAEAGRLRRDLRDGPLPADPAGRPGVGGLPGELDDAGLPGRVHRAGAARHAGHRHHLPQRRRTSGRSSPRWTCSAAGGRCAASGWPGSRPSTAPTAGPFPPVAERYALLEDALQLLPLLWGPGSPAFEGRVLDVPEALCYPRPAAGAGADHRRRRRRAAHAAARRPVRRRGQRLRRRARRCATRPRCCARTAPRSAATRRRSSSPTCPRRSSARDDGAGGRAGRAAAPRGRSAGALRRRGQRRHGRRPHRPLPRAGRGRRRRGRWSGCRTSTDADPLERMAHGDRGVPVSDRRAPAAARTNWAGNVTYAASRFHRPSSVDELRRIVAGARQVRALGTGHSFNRIADTAGDLVSVAGLPPAVEVDAERRTVTVSRRPALRRGRAGAARRGLARCPTSARCRTSRSPAPSRPAPTGRATGNGSLAIGGGRAGAGDRRRRPASRSAASDGERFPGAVVALGALGIVVRAHAGRGADLRRPAVRLRGAALGRTWRAASTRCSAAAYSVSVFTDWTRTGWPTRCGSSSASRRPRRRTPGGSAPDRADGPRHPVPGVAGRQLHRAARRARAVARAAAALPARLHAEQRRRAAVGVPRRPRRGAVDALARRRRPARPGRRRCCRSASCARSPPTTSG